MFGVGNSNFVYMFLSLLIYFYLLKTSSNFEINTIINWKKVQLLLTLKKFLIENAFYENAFLNPLIVVFFLTEASFFSFISQM